MSQVSKKTLNIRGRLLDLTRPAVMGILNLTPDSFFQGSRFRSVREVVDKVGEMQVEGAMFVDLGAYSTRPGAEDISEQEEIERIEAVIEPLAKFYPDLIISIDTFRSNVAKVALQKGGHLINDVSGGALDDAMFEVVAAAGVPYVLMHMRGNPQSMSKMTVYDDLVTDILKDLKGKLVKLRSLGVADVFIDPGFGFAKTIQQNFELMRALPAFASLECPVLVGISRKAMIYRTLQTNPENALNGTTVLNTIALQNGASILRVHDVKAAVEAVKLWSSVSGLN